MADGSVLLGMEKLSFKGGSGADSIQVNHGPHVLEGGLGSDSATISLIGTSTLITASWQAPLGGLAKLNFANGMSLTGFETITILAGTGGFEIGNAFPFGFAPVTVNVVLQSGGLYLLGTGDDNTLTGNTLADELHGLAGNDTLTGLGANDLMFGGAGDDTLDGGTGDDIMRGGAGADTYTVNSLGDLVDEGAVARGDDGAADTVRSSIGYTLGTNVENLVLLGLSGIGGTGNGLDNTITGNGFSNTISGLGGADVLIGNGGNDTLSGGDGDDRLQGGFGDDTMTGGASVDVFVFDQSPITSGIDTITDFSVTDDFISLDDAFFALTAGPDGRLLAGQLFVGAVASHGASMLVYDPTTGGLFYDQDGGGVQAAVRFATLSTGLALTNQDILVI